MNTTIRRTVALAGALAITLGAAACAKSEAPAASPSSSATSTTTSAAPTTTEATAPKASDILKEVKSNALAAKSAAFEGEIEQGGQKMSIAFKGTADGKTSDINLEQAEMGKVHLIAVNGEVYLQGDEKFWKEQGAPESVQKAGDKFVKAPASAGSLADQVNLKSFMDQAFGSLGNSDLDGKVGSETVDGVDCWVLTDKSGKENGALYVAKDSMQLMRFTGTKESPGQLTFSQWNEDLAIKAPAADQIIKL
jgi:hypothetical protein